MPMNSSPRSAGALASCLAATLLLTTLPSVGQTITNPNFDANSFGNFPGYISGNGNTPITGWIASNADRVGLNPSGGTPFADNGTIPSAPNVAFLQATGAIQPSLQTTVSGLNIGTKYNLSVRVNARNGNVPFLRFQIDDPTAGPTINAEVSAVGGTAPYRTVSYEFTAKATSHVITFSNPRPTASPASAANGDHTLVLDSVNVKPSSNAWDFSAWTGDGDSGIDSTHVYTHAFKLATTANVTINGVTFFGRTFTTLPGIFTTTGFTSAASFQPGFLELTGNSPSLASPFWYGGPPTITLENLKPNTQYVFTVYGAGWDADTDATRYRAATFSSNIGTDSFTVNLNHYGKNKGLKVNYTYTTDALATPVAITFPALSGNTFHTSAFSNREVATRASVNAWTAHAWDDDANSGASPNHVYTHAHNYGSSVSPNVNGVNFTGIPGANPSSGNCTTTGLGSVYNGDAHFVTGYGAALATDFVFNGSPAAFNLTGLTPGKQYVFSAYSTGFGNTPERLGAFYSVGETPVVLNQHANGDNRGIRFDHPYTADASGTAKILLHGATGVDSLHICATSNREAAAMVGVAPSITLQPIGKILAVGDSYLLRSTGIGSETLTYQWKHGATDIPGANSPELLLEDVQLSDTGDYSLVVSNSVNSATSNPATITVREIVPGVFSTGVDSLGRALPAGAIDQHYTLITNPDNTSSSTVFVQNPIPGSWVAHSSTSTWVGPRATTPGAMGMAADAGEGPGTYVYRTQIDLTGFDPATVRITGRWATDNSGLAIRVNSVATGIVNNTGSTFGALSPFTIDSTNAPGLIAGINNIDFVVNNSDVAAGYTGLRVVDLRAIGAIPPNTAPRIAVQPQGGAGVHDSPFKLGVGATGSATLVYQWFKGTNPIPDSNSPTIDVAIEDLTSGGDFKVQVSNGVNSVESNVATISVTNANPVAVNDALSVDENSELEIDVVFDLLDNDTDADGDDVTLASFSSTSAEGGTITQDGGYLTYTPEPGFDGVDTFTYTVSDGWGGVSATGTVTITVNNVAGAEPGPMTLVVNLAGNNVTGTFTGSPGKTYILQRSTSLLAGSWIDVDTEVAPESGIVVVVDGSPPAGRAFYRLSYTP